MWAPIIIDSNEKIYDLNIENTPGVVIKNFFAKKKCHKIVNRIFSMHKEKFHKRSNQFIGPFLMSFATKKQQYFDKAKTATKHFEEIFSGIDNPLIQIQEKLSDFFPNYDIKTAIEQGSFYSPCVIRIHPNGTSIPIHKDNVAYEGINYEISSIDSQLSCVLHLQNSEIGGELKIYKQSWTRQHEKYREIEFGYNSKFLQNAESCTIKPKSGDLVIINSKNFHETLPILGKTPRITLGMFVGLKNREIFLWA